MVLVDITNTRERKVAELEKLWNSDKNLKTVNHQSNERDSSFCQQKYNLKYKRLNITLQ